MGPCAAGLDRGSATQQDPCQCQSRLREALGNGTLSARWIAPRTSCIAADSPTSSGSVTCCSDRPDCVGACPATVRISSTAIARSRSKCSRRPSPVAVRDRPRVTIQPSGFAGARIGTTRCSPAPCTHGSHPTSLDGSEGRQYGQGTSGGVPWVLKQGDGGAGPKLAPHSTVLVVYIELACSNGPLLKQPLWDTKAE